MFCNILPGEKQFTVIVIANTWTNESCLKPQHLPRQFPLVRTSRYATTLIIANIIILVYLQTQDKMMDKRLPFLMTLEKTMMSLPKQYTYLIIKITLIFEVVLVWQMKRKAQQDVGAPKKKQRTGLTAFENFIAPSTLQEVTEARKQEQVLFINRQTATTSTQQQQPHPLIQALPNDLPAFAAKHLRYELDVISVEEPDNDTNIILSTPQSTEQVKLKFASHDNKTFTIMNVEKHHPPLASLIQQLDTGLYEKWYCIYVYFFRGNVGTSNVIFFSCNEQNSYFPYAIDSDRFIVAIDSPLLVCIFEDARKDHGEDVKVFSRGSATLELFPSCVELDEASLQYELDAGDTLYIPAGEVAFVCVNKASIWSEILLPNAPSTFESIVTSQLEKVETQITDNNMYAKASLLNQLVLAQIPAVEKTKTFTSLDFLSAMSHIKQYNLKKLVADNGGLVRIENFFPTAIAEKIHEYAIVSMLTQMLVCFVPLLIGVSLRHRKIIRKTISTINIWVPKHSHLVMLFTIYSANCCHNKFAPLMLPNMCSLII